MGTQAVAGILARLREQMDYVLVDAPPMLTVSDAATLSTRVDAIAMVVRLGLVNRPMLRDLARELEASPAPKLGFILTGAGVTEQYAVAPTGRAEEGTCPQGRYDRGVGPEPLEAPRALAEQPSSPPSGLIEAEGPARCARQASMLPSSRFLRRRTIARAPSVASTSRCWPSRSATSSG